MVVIFTDLIVIITQAVGVLKEISFQVIYAQIFMVIRSLASSTNNSKSRLMQIYEMFITQIYSYISGRSRPDCSDRVCLLHDGDLRFRDHFYCA